MVPLREELRTLSSRRRRLGVELLASLCLSAVLLPLLPLLEASGPEAHTLFLVASAILALATAELLSRLLALLDFDCPRCSHRFHGSARHVLDGLPDLWSACAHCGLSSRDHEVSPRSETPGA